jgi:hypothetical protein
MATIELPLDFKEFLQLLNDHEVDYLLIGGFAVALYGYPRPTDDIDVWVAMNPENAAKLVAVLLEFGMVDTGLEESLFLRERNIVRMGIAPNRIEISMAIDVSNSRSVTAEEETYFLKVSQSS